ncbi:hypothetical protein LCGC14_1096270 [marine sediment metagenome]|uniref:Uncharacterized protein n=1 Tax=marine sediment metagenome TaxID=412755 RepID=A0A0F9PTZ5_9ZZZZ
MPRREDETYLNKGPVKTCPYGHWVGIECEKCKELKKPKDLFQDIIFPEEDTK